MSFVWGSLFSDHEKTPVTAKSPKNSFLGKKWKLFSSRHRQLWGRVPESKRRKGRVWAVVVAGGHVMKMRIIMMLRFWEIIIMEPFSLPDTISWSNNLQNVMSYSRWSTLSLLPERTVAGLSMNVNQQHKGLEMDIKTTCYSICPCQNRYWGPPFERSPFLKSDPCIWS